jgi:hypothetical protein
MSVSVWLRIVCFGMVCLFKTTTVALGVVSSGSIQSGFYSVGFFF